MPNLQTFMYQDSPVSVVLCPETGEILFDATSICSVLDYANPSDVLRRLLDDDEKILLARKIFDPMATIGSPGPRHKNFVTEPGLYKLIFQSQKQEAKQFTRWVTHEVLPQIRQTGKYAPKPDKIDMPKVQRTLTAAKKAAKDMGLTEHKARHKAAEVTQQQTGVDIYEVLGLERPTDQELRLGIIVDDRDTCRETASLMQDLYELNRERFHHRDYNGQTVRANHEDPWGVYDERKRAVFFFVPKLRAEFDRRGIAWSTLSSLKKAKMLLVHKGKHQSLQTKVAVFGTRVRSVALSLDALRRD